jgi:hypothetical protein
MCCPPRSKLILRSIKKRNGNAQIVWCCDPCGGTFSDCVRPDQQGPKGEQGPPGPQGSKGDQGLPLAAWLACRKSRDSTWCDRRGSSLSGAFASGRRLCRITGQSELFPFHDAFVSEAFSD